RPGMLDTRPFYQTCRARLSNDGIMVVNLLGLKRGFKSSYERIREAFDGRCLAFPSCDSGNVITFATAGHPVCVSMDHLRNQAHKLKEAFGLNLLPTLSRLEKAQSCPGGVFSL
ncbi:MAG: class I SAM-dependent methyltransferase, partial [Burkholderiales bacterium]